MDRPSCRVGSKSYSTRRCHCFESYLYVLLWRTFSLWPRGNTGGSCRGWGLTSTFGRLTSTLCTLSSLPSRSLTRGSAWSCSKINLRIAYNLDVSDLSKTSQELLKINDIFLWFAKKIKNPSEPSFCFIIYQESKKILILTSTIHAHAYIFIFYM